MPLFFLSGALFPLNLAPQFLQLIAQVNPLAYGVDGLRDSLIGIHHFGLGLDFLVLSTLSLICLIVGSYLFSKIQI